MSFDDFLQRVGLERPVGIEVPAGHSAFAPAHEADAADGTQSFSLANGTALDSRLGFVVGSVIVDNNTSSYLNLPDATKDGTGRWVGPGQGAALPILGHISRARVNWTAPPGKNQISPVAGEFAQLVFLATPEPPGFGLAVPSPNTLPWVSPNQPAKQINETLAANADSVGFSIPGVAGQQIYLFYMSIGFDAVVAAQNVALERIDNNAQLWQFPTASLVPNPLQGYGAVIAPVGVGLKLHNFASVAVTVRGGCVYSQA